MQNFPQTNTPPYPVKKTGDEIYTRTLAGMYGWIAVGLMVASVSAWFWYQSGIRDSFGMIGFLVCFGISLGLLIALHVSVRKAPLASTAGLYLAFTTAEGAMLSGIFGSYTTGTIVLAFGLTGGLFVTLAIIGHNTTRDLSGWLPMLTAGLISLVVASLANLLIGSGALSWVITIATIPVFIGLTIWETREAKELAREAAQQDDHMAANRIAIISATGLYLNFLNLFLALLRTLGFLGSAEVFE